MRAEGSGVIDTLNDDTTGLESKNRAVKGGHAVFRGALDRQLLAALGARSCIPGPPWARTAPPPLPPVDSSMGSAAEPASPAWSSPVSNAIIIYTLLDTKRGGGVPTPPGTGPRAQNHGRAVDTSTSG